MSTIDTLTKVITVYGRAYRVYSLDGITWSSSKRDLMRYAERYEREKRETQRVFSRIDTAEQYEIIY